MSSMRYRVIPWVIFCAILSLQGCQGFGENSSDPENPSVNTLETGETTPDSAPSGSFAVSDTVPDSTKAQPETPPPLKQPTTSADTTSITLYSVDSNCDALVPQKVIAPSGNSLEFAVAQVFDLNTNEDFPLSYRLEVDSDHQAVTIDLRIPTTSPRPLTALSACEQLALFGSLRKTLTENPQWQVHQVHFTHAGKEVAL
ncbi:MAG: hypothetical protein ACFBSC_00990 [Microcoleaceae cyanobacterium]